MRNPILEAEAHSLEVKRDYFLCDICKGKIYKEDDTYEGDTYYDFDGVIVCEECIRKYTKSHMCRA